MAGSCFADLCKEELQSNVLSRIVHVLYTMCSVAGSATLNMYQCSELSNMSCIARNNALPVGNSWAIFPCCAMLSMDAHAFCQHDKWVPTILNLCLQAMSDWAIKAGSRVLVHAGSSGVGTWVVQIAKVCIVTQFSSFDLANSTVHLPQTKGY